MHDFSTVGQTSSLEDDVDAPAVCCEADRNRLVDDLSFLVVRQFRHHKRVQSDDETTAAYVEVEPK